MNSPKVCIIGAGASGITTAKAMKSAGIAFDCYEAGSKIGGNWLYMNDNGMSSSYRSLHINTSKQLMEYSDFPMPKEYPDYPSHRYIYEYFENYVDHFQIREHIQFNSLVEKVEKLDNHRFMVYVQGKEPQEYSDVIVANGHHWQPKYPQFEGEFSGEITHAHDYKTYEGFENKKVLIVGIGNSAVDIACELTTVAESVTISTRSGAHILPKYLFGIPTDHLSKPPLAYAPLGVQISILKLALWLNVGNQKNYGLPTPKREILKEHPTISQELLNKIGHGKIKIKPNISKLNGKNVLFTDQSTQEFDHIIYATGYSVSFPFFDKNFIHAENNELSLYEFVVHPRHRGLYFVGLIQPLGAVMPLAELQAKWIGKIINKEASVPDEQDMQSWFMKNRKKMKDRFGDSSRHTLEVDFFPYKKTLMKLINQS
ncbi:MAG: NAD(P)-binding domain-containing protein [Bacteroidetes bacterium]|nr:NAD(P)-binding domain-containing protein [Bacteroidota bacterium]